MAWISNHPYLSTLALIVVGCSVLALLFWLSDRHGWTYDPQPAAEPEPVTGRASVARHRAGAVDNKPYRNPLDSWVRQSMAPTANAEIALPAGPTEETCALRPPTRDDQEVTR